MAWFYKEWPRSTLYKELCKSILYKEGPNHLENISKLNPKGLVVCKAPNAWFYKKLPRSILYKE